MKNKVLIKEIFESVQGEGLFIGVNQLFVRFARCNLCCEYCDTDFKSNLTEYSAGELAFEVNKYENIHSVSLTGGEPLCETEFLSEFLPLTDKKIYLETNGILYENLGKIVDNIDIIAMDIKLPSCSKMSDFFCEHENFIKISVEKKKEIFLKVVFDEKITQEEIIKTSNLAEKYNLTLVLQPKMNADNLKLPYKFIIDTYYEFLKNYKNIRLIPQMHKFLNIR